MTLSTSDVQFIICEKGSFRCWNYAKTREAAQAEASKQENETGRPFEVLPWEDFAARETAHWLGEFPLSEITEEFHDEMLNVLPPMYRQGAAGFFMCEMTSGSITSQFCRIDGRYYGAAVDLADRSTWISREKVEALPADRKRLEWFKREEGAPAHA